MNFEEKHDRKKRWIHRGRSDAGEIGSVTTTEQKDNKQLKKAFLDHDKRSRKQLPVVLNNGFIIRELETKGDREELT